MITGAPSTGVTAFSGMMPASPGRMQIRLQSRAMAAPVSKVMGSRDVIGGPQHQAGDVRNGQTYESDRSAESGGDSGQQSGGYQQQITGATDVHA